MEKKNKFFAPLLNKNSFWLKRGWILIKKFPVSNFDPNNAVTSNI